MGYDIRICAKAGPLDDLYAPLEGAELRLSYNHQPLLAAIGTKLPPLDESSATYVEQVAARALKAPEDDPAKWRTYSAPNDENSYLEVLGFMRKLLELCERFPGGFIKVW